MMKHWTQIDMESTGKRIKYWRKRRGMTQQDIAKIIGVTNMGVSRWERGENMPSLDHAMMLADLLKVSVEELILME